MNPAPALAVLLTYLGTACFLLEYDGVAVLTDPGDFLTRRLTAEKAKSLPDVDLVLITHADFDHVNRLRYVPGIKGIPIMGPESVRKAFPDLNYLAGDEASVGGIRIKKIETAHGVRHAVPHTGYAIEAGEKVIYDLGDGYDIGEAVPRHPDYLLVTIGGLESNVGNALKNVGVLEPRYVIPMHWEGLSRWDAKARALKLEIAGAYPLVNCLIPPYDTAINLE
jgi:L-ascorbate metabolism protein UlaG (beta-lactamase superfamily)